MVGPGRDRCDRGLVVRRALGVVHLHEPLRGVRDQRADLGPVDLPVGGDVDPDRVVRVRDQDGPGEVRPDGAAAVGLLALAGGPADAANQVVDERVVAAVGGEVLAEMAHAGDPGAPVVVGLRVAGPVLDVVAVVRLAPRDRVVLAHPVRTRCVGALVERRQHVVVAADVAVPVVVLVAELERVVEVAGREVVAVGDLDGGLVVQVRRRVAGHRGADDRVGAAVPPVPGLDTGAGVGHVVGGDDAAAALDEADDRLFLCRVPKLARRAAGAGEEVGRVQQHDRIEAGEVRVGEHPRVLVRVLALTGAGPEPGAVLPGDLEAERLEPGLHDRAAVVDGAGVAEAGGARVEEDALALTLGRGGGRCERQHRGERE